MGYVPHTEAEREAMLKAVGIETMDDLFAHLPKETIAKKINIGKGLSESETIGALEHLARRNRPASELICFAGGGAYDHFIPPAVWEILSRGELYTAYTPYQPEASQGVLQATFEYQTMICALTGMDVSNASLYDGATALVEAALMAVRATGRRRLVVDDGLHPNARSVLATYLRHSDIETARVPTDGFISDLEGLAKALDERSAAVLAGYPNFFGSAADLSPLMKRAKDLGALGIVMAYPLSLGLLKSPGEMGADIVCGEGQSLGIPLSFGGPYLGYLACRENLIRNLPGRIVGETVDSKGERAFALTLQTREQHIRRDKATSNICTNQALCALAAGAYMALVGRSGIAAAASLCASLAEYARRRLALARGVTRVFEYPAFNEFAIEIRRPAHEAIRGLVDRGFLGGVDLGRFVHGERNRILIAVTEKRTLPQIDALASALGEVLA